MLKILNSISNDNKELFERALNIRKSEWGNTVTYSRKVFVPLTNMCRDTCSYCTFVKHPNSKLAKILNPDEVMNIVDLGEKSGCFAEGSSRTGVVGTAQEGAGYCEYALPTQGLSNGDSSAMSGHKVLQKRSAGSPGSARGIRRVPRPARQGSICVTV